MKKIKILILIFLQTALLISQNQGDINPFVNAIAYTPTSGTGYPLGTFTCGSNFTATFNIGQTTNLYDMPPSTLYPGGLDGFNNLIIDFTITNLNFNPTGAVNTSANGIVSGAYASFFNWTYAASNRIRGVQSMIIPPSDISGNGAGQIRIPISVPNQSNCVSCMLINATLQIPSYVNQVSGQTGDDAASTNASFNCRTLPVSYIDFYPELKSNNNCLLNFNTVNEIHTKEFQVERKLVDDKDFTIIGTVEATSNLRSSNTYSYLDKGLKSNFKKAYYRIKQIDQNGAFIYTDIKSVKQLNSNIALTSYPNPFQSRLNLEIEIDHDSKLSMEVVDMLGRSVRKEQFNVTKGNNQRSFDMKILPVGSYILRVYDGSFSDSIRLVKAE